MVRLLALSTSRLYPLGNNPGTHFSYSLSEPHVHSAAGWIMSMKNFKDTFENRTRPLPACSAVLFFHLTTVNESEVLFMFVTPNAESIARDNSERLFMLRAIFCIKICVILHCVIQCYSKYEQHVKYYRNLSHMFPGDLF